MTENICLFAGTSEGRELARHLGAHCRLTVCVATEYGEILLEHSEAFTVRTGRMSEDCMRDFFAQQRFTRILDATHPYAELVTENIRRAAEACGIPLMRILRGNADEPADAVRVESAEEAARWLTGTSGNILLTTGAKELPAFAALDAHRLFARVLPLPESLAACAQSGIEPAHILAMQGPFSEEMNLAQLHACSAAFLVTKQSGKQGGFTEKMSAAQKGGVRVVLIGRPPQTDGLTFEAALSELNRLLGIAPKSEIAIVGIGPGSTELLTQEAVTVLRDCDCLIGAARVTEALAGFHKPVVCEIDPQKIRQAIDAHPQYTRFAAVMSGDVGFYSGAKKLAEALHGRNVRMIPGISSAVLLAARAGIPWEDVKLMSLHGRSQNLIAAVRRNRRVIALTGGEQTVNAVCKTLCEYGLEQVAVTVGQRLSYPDEQLTRGTARELAERDFASLSVMLIENNAFASEVRHGIADEEFIRSEAPMTKSEIRSVSLSKLRLRADSVVWDIGAGTGSVSVEAALAAYDGTVFAIEKQPEAAALIRQNALKFAVSNLVTVEGCAPEALDALPAPTHAFIGGSSGNLADILRVLLQRNPTVRVVVNTVTLETLAEAVGCMREFGFDEQEVVCVNVSRARRLGGYRLMTAQNPVYVLSMQKR